MGFELGNMEYGVDAAHVRRELEGNGVGTGASDYLVGTKVLLRKLLRRLSGLNELGKKERFGSDREVRRRHAMAIRRGLIAFLSFGDGNLKLSVKFIEI